MFATFLPETVCIRFLLTEEGGATLSHCRDPRFKNAFLGTPPTLAFDGLDDDGAVVGLVGCA